MHANGVTQLYRHYDSNDRWAPRVIVSASFVEKLTKRSQTDLPLGFSLYPTENIENFYIYKNPSKRVC